MTLIQRRSLSKNRRAKPHAPSCRGGVSSLLRLAQPAALVSAFAGGARLPAPLQAVDRSNDFAPSRWLIGH
jgi:hypothetical protein